MTLSEKLSAIQATINVPKGQYNSFGKYAYRSCEDILTAVKPYLAEHKLTLSLSDEIKQVGERYYIQATATISDGEQSISTTAIARESADKRGMDDAQVTCSTSSYARKYALNGLFAIDDAKDCDSDEAAKEGINRQSKQNKTAQKTAAPPKQDTPTCSACKRIITGFNNGTVKKTAQEVAKDTGGLCLECFKKNKKAEEQQNVQ